MGKTDTEHKIISLLNKKEVGGQQESLGRGFNVI